MRCIFLLDLHKNRQKTEWDFGCPLRPTISLLDLHRLGPQTCSKYVVTMYSDVGWQSFGGILAKENVPFLLAFRTIRT